MVGKVYFDCLPSRKSIETFVWTRVFSNLIDEKDLVWHQDLCDREIKVHFPSYGWEIQFENQLPMPLIPGDIIKIKSFTYHRIIKTENVKASLCIEIKEKLYREEIIRTED